MRYKKAVVLDDRHALDGWIAYMEDNIVELLIYYIAPLVEVRRKEGDARVTDKDLKELCDDILDYVAREVLAVFLRMEMVHNVIVNLGRKWLQIDNEEALLELVDTARICMRAVKELKAKIR